MIETPPVKPEISSNRPSSSTRKKRILVVDDERDIRERIRSAVNSHYWVDTAGNASDALRAYKPHFHDLILSDHRMQNIDGAESYREIKRIDPMQRVCIITAYDELDTRIMKLQ